MTLHMTASTKPRRPILRIKFGQSFSHREKPGEHEPGERSALLGSAGEQNRKEAEALAESIQTEKVI